MAWYPLPKSLGTRQWDNIQVGSADLIVGVENFVVGLTAMSLGQESRCNLRGGDFEGRSVLHYANVS